LATSKDAEARHNASKIRKFTKTRFRSLRSTLVAAVKNFPIAWQILSLAICPAELGEGIFQDRAKGWDISGYPETAQAFFLCETRGIEAWGIA
jgi:hypothetical protein